MQNFLLSLKENKTIKSLKKTGAMSIQFVLVCLVTVVLITTVLTEFQHMLIIRNIEATADLAAVEALRMYVDEQELRDENLVIQESDLPNIRRVFLEKIRENLPNESFAIERIEIPTLQGGTVQISEDYMNQQFPNSDTTPFNGPHATYQDGKAIRTEYYVDGTSTDNAAMSIVKDLSNLATSGEKPKTSYILTSKVTVIFKTTPLLNTVQYGLLNYVDIFTDKATAVVTQQVGPDSLAITIQAIGKVTLR